MSTWGLDQEGLVHQRLGVADWGRVLRRGVPLIVLVFGGLLLLLSLRLLEKPLHGPRRPWTPGITQTVCRGALWLLGLPRNQRGVPDQGAAAAVANHASWLDIFALNAGQRLTFVAKSEVAGWPGIGWLARATGTLFVRRHRSEARGQVSEFQKRLGHGDPLLFFPEGTSTDGLQVLPFKPTLFAAFFDVDAQDLRIQPITVIYHAAPGVDPRQYGWWGDMEFGPHLLSTLAAKQQGRVEVLYHQSVPVAEMADRKGLAKSLETAVRAGMGKGAS